MIGSSADMSSLVATLNNELDTSQWPQIIDISEDDTSLALSLRVAPALKWFEGHFPDNPVLPGVVQVHWAVSFAKRLLVDDRAFQKVENLKFKSVVLPGMDLQLVYRKAGVGDKLRFSFHGIASHEVHSEGRLSFA